MFWKTGPRQVRLGQPIHYRVDCGNCPFVFRVDTIMVDNIELQCVQCGAYNRIEVTGKQDQNLGT